MVINDFIHTEIVKRIDLRIKFASDIVNGVLYLRSCNWKWMQLTNKVNVDGVVYDVVVSDDLNYDFMIVGFLPSSVTDVDLLNFHYYEGTAIDVTTVFSTISNVATEKLPMVWLSFNPLPLISTSSDVTASHKIDVDCTIYLAGLTDYGVRHTKEHMEEVVKYLVFYKEEIAKVMNLNDVFNRKFSIAEKQLPIFGSIGKSGFTANILDETNLSAIELKLAFKTEKKCYC